MKGSVAEEEVGNKSLNPPLSSKTLDAFAKITK